MIALCSKCYFIEDSEGEKKFSTKGVSKKQNEITAQRFEKALEGSKDMATNIGFRMNNGRIVTYEQQKLGLSAYYDNAGYWKTVFTQNRSSFIVRLPVVAVYLEGQPKALRGQTSVLVRQTNNR